MYTQDNTCVHLYNNIHMCTFQYKIKQVNIFVGGVMERATITFSTTEDIKKILDNMAQEENRTLSNLIETIILKYLENSKK